MEIRPYQYQRSDAAPNQNYLLEPENDPDPAQTPGNKKAITYEKDSRIFVYTPLVMEDEYINQESNLFLKRFYNGNLSSMLSAYIENDRLSPSEIDTLRGILSDSGHKGGA